MEKEIIVIIEDELKYCFGDSDVGKIRRFDEFIHSVKNNLNDNYIKVEPFALFNIIMDILRANGRYVDFNKDGIAFIISNGVVVHKDSFSEIKEGDSNIIEPCEVDDLETFLFADEEYVAKRAKALKILKVQYDQMGFHKSLYDPSVVLKAKKKVVIKAIQKNMSNEDISELTDLSIREVEEIRRLIMK